MYKASILYLLISIVVANILAPIIAGLILPLLFHITLNIANIFALWTSICGITFILS